MGSLDLTLAWRDRLRRAPLPPTRLSPAGLRLVLDDALDALDALPEAVAGAEPGDASVALVAASTVVTAPLEWIAVLLAMGRRVTLKISRRDPGLGLWFADHAAALGLPLTVHDDPARLTEPGAADLVVAMASDSTLDALRTTLPPGVGLLGFGHRVSAAWWPRHAAIDRETADALARDLAAHDGRGCMTPGVVLTDADPDALADALAEALDAAQARWPRGALTDHEGAALRARDALARVAGRTIQGDAWSMHILPPAIATPEALPRAVTLVSVADEAAAARWLASHPLSTLGAPAGVAHALTAPRVCAIGQIQRPPLIRRHDGFDHLDALRRLPRPAGGRTPPEP